ncbi:unnamed protein product [Bemisia tabaci]|uniref:PID domain-containing protein n=2 Tax=Bemisia tabaci TaxID=7038 RepID=A0A9P0AAH2_BEMTA|nr:unnamed protein product [Bemisia tabaci]
MRLLLRRSVVEDADEARMSGGSALIKEDLPGSFLVKYLGTRESRGLWGIKHTRKPVDAMVAAAKEPGVALPMLTLTVQKEGIRIQDAAAPAQGPHQFYPIETISYGVQDLVYTRVFAMIIVKDVLSHRARDAGHPFVCHAFVCESRQVARKLTYTLATAFQLYSRRIRVGAGGSVTKFAIDLRSPQEMESDLRMQDSEA